MLVTNEPVDQVWEITGWSSSRLQESYHHYGGIYRLYPNSIKKIRNMSTSKDHLLVIDGLVDWVWEISGWSSTLSA